MTTVKIIPNVNAEIVDALIKHYDLGPDATVDTLVLYLGAIMKAFNTFVRREEDALDEAELEPRSRHHENLDGTDYRDGQRDLLARVRDEHSKYSQHLLCIMAANVTVKDLHLEGA